MSIWYQEKLVVVAFKLISSFLRNARWKVTVIATVACRDGGCRRRGGPGHPSEGDIQIDSARSFFARQHFFYLKTLKIIELAPDIHTRYPHQGNQIVSASFFCSLTAKTDVAGGAFKFTFVPGIPTL